MIPPPYKTARLVPARGMSRAQTLGLALAAGAAAALLAGVLLARQTAAMRTAAPTVAVVTAARDLPPRTLLQPRLLHLTTLPAAAVPPGAYTQIKFVAGQISKTAIVAGQPLTPGEIEVRGDADGIAPQIAPSDRAVSIPLDAAGGATGFLEPGDHVDVFAADGQTAAHLVVGDARLLALSAHGSGPATSATLEMSLQAALQLAAAQGRLTLALRGLGDDAPADAEAEMVLPASHPPAPAPVAPLPVKAPAGPATPPVAPVLHPALPHPQTPPAQPQVTVVRGTQTSTVSVEN